MADRNTSSLGVYRGVPVDDASQLETGHFPATDIHIATRSQDADNAGNDDYEASGGEDPGFLPMDYERESVVRNQYIDKAVLRKVLTMSIIFLFIVELGSFIMEPPLGQIMQDFICHKTYPDHKMGQWRDHDPRCKETAIEGILVVARSWMMWAKLVVPLFVQIPFGVMADKYGRRPILFLALLGSFLATGWNFVVLMGPDTFSVWQLPLGSVATLIGGGDPVTIAIAYTILIDVVSADARTDLFYKLHAMMLIMSAATRPIAGWLMSEDPWLPMWIGLLAIGLSAVLALFVPETLHLSQTTDNLSYTTLGPDRLAGQRPLLAELVGKGMRLARTELLQIWRFVFSSRRVMLLTAAYGLSNPIFMTFEMNMLQYMTVRYHWTWSTATYYSIISKLTSVVVLLGILPFASRATEDRSKGNVVSRDIFLALASVGLITASNLLTVAAAVPWLLMVALIVYGAGGGFWAQVPMVETLAGLVGIPLLGWLLSKGITFGGFWIGLPFVMTSACAVLTGLALLMFKRL